MPRVALVLAGTSPSIGVAASKTGHNIWWEGGDPEEGSSSGHELAIQAVEAPLFPSPKLQGGRRS